MEIVSSLKALTLEFVQRHVCHIILVETSTRARFNIRGSRLLARRSSMCILG